MTAEVTTLIKLETVAELDGAKKFDDGLKKNQRTINSVTKDLQIQERMLRKKGRSYQFVKAHIGGATKAELRNILAMEKNIARMTQQNAQMGRNTKGLRLMRGGLGQIGHQVQDVAVQLQGGTDAMIVFGQQGSQVASLFGPHGAMLGAVLAVGAALFTSFKPAVDDSKESLKEIIKTTKEQAVELGLLTEAQKAYQQIQKQDVIDEAIENNEKLNKQLRNQQAELDRANAALEEGKAANRAFNNGVLVSTVGLKHLEEVHGEAEQAVTKTKSAIDDTTGVINQYKDGVLDTAEAEKERLEKINELIRAAAEEAHTTGMSAEQLAIYKAQMEGANDTQLKGIRHLHSLIAAKIAEKKATEDAEKAEEKRQATIDGLIKSAATQASTIGMNKRQLDLYKAGLEGARQEEKDSLNSLHDLIDARNDVASIKSLIESLTEQTAVIGMTNRELDIYKAKNRGAKEEDIATINTLHDLSEARRQVAEDIKFQNSVAPKTERKGMGQIVSEFDSLIESQKTELDLFREHQEAKLALVDEHERAVNDVMTDYNEIRRQIADETAAYEIAARMQTQQQVLGIMSQQVNQLGGMFDQATTLGKAFYVAQQGLAAAQAIISGEVASVKILEAHADLPGGMAIAAPMAAMAKMMGYASAAAIAGQTVASFEGGGMTFSGVRSGGMDGKGGRMAMVHPNEKITDMEKQGGSAGPVNVNINISAVDAKGVDELLVKRRGMITNLVRSSLANSGSRLG